MPHVTFGHSFIPDSVFLLSLAHHTAPRCATLCHGPLPHGKKKIVLAAKILLRQRKCGLILGWPIVFVLPTNTMIETVIMCAFPMIALRECRKTPTALKTNKLALFQQIVFVVTANAIALTEGKESQVRPAPISFRETSSFTVATRGAAPATNSYLPRVFRCRELLSRSFSAQPCFTQRFRRSLPECHGVTCGDRLLPVSQQLQPCFDSMGYLSCASQNVSFTSRKCTAAHLRWSQMGSPLCSIRGDLMLAPSSVSWVSL